MSIRRRIELFLDRAAARRVERETQRSLEKGTDPRKAERNVRRVRSVFDRLRGSVLELGAAIASAFAVRRIVDFGRQTLQAFSRQESAILRVNSALRNMGAFTEENTKLLQENAAAIQRVTRAGDEAILEATATIAELATELTVGELAQAQTAAVALADTFFGGNVSSAAVQVAKSIGSATNSLSRYGVALDASGTQQEKLAQLLEFTEPLYRTSQRAALDLAGSSAQLSNSWGDLQEQLGEIITRGLGLNEGLRETRQVVDAVTSSLEENEVRIAQWGTVVLPLLKAFGQSIAFIFRALFNLGQIAAGGLELVALAFQRSFAPSVNQAIELLNLLPGVDIQVRMNELTPEEFRAEQERIFQDIDRNATDVADAIMDLGDSYRSLGSAAVAAATGQAGAQVAENATGAPSGGAPSGGAADLGLAIQEVNMAVLTGSLLLPDYRAELEAAAEAAGGLALTTGAAAEATDELALTTGAAAEATDGLADAQSRLRGGLGLLGTLSGIAGFAIPGLGLASQALSAFRFARTAFAGEFADGGMIPAGQFGLVGERGPELVSGPATVTPFPGIVLNVPPAKDPISWARDQDYQRTIATVNRLLRAQGHR